MTHRPANPPEYLKLLAPEALSRIHRMELLARGVVEGFISGRHRSPYRGFSVEFAEHREYAPGDNPRDLDWRVLGRTDRYFIKQYMEETNLRCTLLLDCSGSMRYTGERAARYRGERLSKFEYARYLAACLAHLMIHQQDAVGLVLFDSQVRRYLPARSRTGHLRSLLEAMTGAAPGEETALAPVFHDIAERVHRRSLVIILSDFFDEPEAILRALHHFRFRKHEVIALHIMADEELTFPFESWSLFRDLEHDANRLELDPRSLRAAYLDEVRRFTTQLRTGCGQMRIDYASLSTRQDFDVALAGYLGHRRSQARQGVR